eukprot:41444-Eustigmatos_ZCMA.PRE.1
MVDRYLFKSYPSNYIGSRVATIIGLEIVGEYIAQSFTGCRKKVEVRGSQSSTLKNGCQVIKGTCPGCGNKVAVIQKKGS